MLDEQQIAQFANSVFLVLVDIAICHRNTPHLFDQDQMADSMAFRSLASMTWSARAISTSRTALTRSRSAVEGPSDGDVSRAVAIFLSKSINLMTPAGHLQVTCKSPVSHLS